MAVDGTGRFGGGGLCLRLQQLPLQPQPLQLLLALRPQLLDGLLQELHVPAGHQREAVFGGGVREELVRCFRARREAGAGQRGDFWGFVDAL